MKQGWEIKKLGEVAEYFNGLTYSPKDVSNNGTIVLRSSNIQNDVLDFSDIVRVSVSIKEKLYLKEGDILMCSRNGSQRLVGKTAPIMNLKEPMTFGTFMMIIRSKSSPYLLWFFKTDEFKKQISGGENTMINQVTRYMLDEIKIPIPPLSEQQHIVSILDEVFAAIDNAKANAEQNLKNAKELFESYLQGVFENGNWEKKKLQDVASVFGRGKSKHRPRNWQGLYGGNFPFIQTGEVRNANKYISSYTQTYNEVGLAQSKLWKKGTICITIAANIAETAILDFDACIPDSIIGFEVDQKKADLNFAYYLLQYFKTELQKLGKGSAQDNINLGTFENQFFPFPPIKEQQSIVRQLDALRAETQKLEAMYQKEIADLEELKKSILQKAFAGELKTEKVRIQ